MSMRIAAFFAFACLAGAAAAQAAGPSLDIVPAAGATPVHLRVSQVSADPEGPRMAPTDIVLRRTGPASAVLQRGSDVSPLTLGADGSLHLDARTAPANEVELTDLLAVLNVAHSVVGVASAGDRGGWIAQVPAPVRAPVVVVSPAPSPAPAPPPLLLPMRAVASSGANGGTDIDGTLVMVLAPPVSSAVAPAQSQAQQQSRSRGGGRGGYGGRGGGYPAGSGGEAARGVPSLPVTFDLHVAGHIANNALTHMTIAQTRRVQFDGSVYSNIRTWTIDVIH